MSNRRDETEPSDTRTKLPSASTPPPEARAQHGGEWKRLSRARLLEQAITDASWKHVGLVCGAGLGKTTTLEWLETAINHHADYQGPFLAYFDRLEGFPTTRKNSSHASRRRSSRSWPRTRPTARRLTSGRWRNTFANTEAAIFWAAYWHTTETRGRETENKNKPHPDAEVEGKSADDYYPAVNVSWYDVWCFAIWLGAVSISGRRYRLSLPSEAQWEYACRAGRWGEEYSPFTFGPDHDGQNVTPDMCNFDGNYPFPKGTSTAHIAKALRNRGKTVGVSEFGANRWGFYQMHGNVWEWCRDWYSKSFCRSTEAALLDPVNLAMASARVLRGGGLSSDGGGVPLSGPQQGRAVVPVPVRRVPTGRSCVGAESRTSRKASERRSGGAGGCRSRRSRSGDGFRCRWIGDGASVASAKISVLSLVESVQSFAEWLGATRAVFRGQQLSQLRRHCRHRCPIRFIGFG